jgi:hypothetical protein
MSSGASHAPSFTVAAPRRAPPPQAFSGSALLPGTTSASGRCASANDAARSIAAADKLRAAAFNRA